MSTIEANFPELMPDNLASVYPRYVDIWIVLVEIFIDNTFCCSSWEEVGDEVNPRAIKPRRLDI
jgi:hypothetical protein